MQRRYGTLTITDIDASGDISAKYHSASDRSLLLSMGLSLRHRTFGSDTSTGLFSGKGSRRKTIVVGGTKLFHFTTGATYLDIGNFVVQLGILIYRILNVRTALNGLNSDKQPTPASSNITTGTISASALTVSGTTTANNVL
jgi:hypothetical protein